MHKKTFASIRLQKFLFIFLWSSVPGLRLLVHNQGRLGMDCDLSGIDLVGGLLVDLSVLTDDGVGGLGDGYLLCLARGVEDDDDVTPVVTSCIVLQAEGDNALGGIKEFQVLAHKMGIAQTESGMMLAQGDEVLIVFEHLGVTLQVGPIEVVDAVGRLEGVVDTFLVAQQLFATEHERYALRGEHGSLRQQVKTNQLVHLTIGQLTIGRFQSGDAGLETIYQTHIVVTGDIGHHLGGF